MTASAFASTRVLLDALRSDRTPSEWESDLIRAGVGWEDLAVRAIVFGLAPLFRHKLKQWAVNVPRRAAAKLEAVHQASALRNKAIFAQLEEVLAGCAERGLRPIALKGAHLASAVYSDPTLRPMNDIDLLFAPEEMPVVERILQSLGYGGKHKSAALGPGITKHVSTFRRSNGSGHTPNPYLSAESDRTIEPHISLEESWFGLTVDITPGVRERAAEYRFGGSPCRVLAAEDLLLHLCVHFCFHLIMGAPSMVQLADLQVVSERMALNWDVLVQRAVDHRAAAYVLAALVLAQKLLAAPIPAPAFEALAAATPPPLRRRIERLGLADVLRRTQQQPLNTVAQRIRRGLSDRAETARWALDWRGRWRVWQTALNVTSTDTARLILGRKSN